MIPATPFSEDPQFNQVMGGYYQRYANGGTTQQLVQFARKTASRDLAPFFDDWLYSTRWTGLVARSTSIAELAEHYRMQAAGAQ